MMRYLQIVEIATGDIIHSVDVSNKSERDIEKIERGMLRLVRDDFMVRDTATQEETP